MAKSAPVTVKSAVHAKAGIGIVESVIGVVTATDTAGVQRVLHLGDVVNANDVIQTAAAGAIDIRFANDTHLDLGRNSQIALDSEVFDPRQAVSDDASIAALQAQIAAGGDPTAVLAPTAAGPGAGGAGGDEGGNSFVVVDQLAARGNVTSGFDTSGGLVLPPLPPILGGTDAPALGGAPGDVPAPVVPPAVPPVVPPVVVTVPPADVPANVAPVAVNDTYSTSEDTRLTAATVLGNDTDANGNALTATLVTQAGHGTVAFNADGTFTYTPNANYNGPDSFTYKANDGSADSNVATVNLTVTPVNDAPVAVKDQYDVVGGTTLVSSVAGPADAGVLHNDSDVDGNPLTAILDRNVSHGTLALHADGSFTYTPNEGFVGVDSFTYHANDGSADSAVVTATIVVDAPENVPPVSVKDQYGAVAGTELVATVAGPGDFGVLHNDTDADGNALTAVLDRNVSHGTLALHADGSFTYTANDGFVGVDSFTYHANDGTANGATVTATIVVDAPDNVPPVSAKDEYSALSGTELVATVAGPNDFGVLHNDTDADGNTLTAVLDRNVAHGTLALHADGSFTYTANAGFVGVDSFTYHANDGTANGAITTATIFVDPLIAATSQTVTGAENTALSIVLSGSETGSQVSDFVITALPLDGHLFLADGVTAVTVGMTISAAANQATLLFRPDAGESGGIAYATPGTGDQHATYAQFSYVAEDGGAQSAAALVSINIAPVVDPVALHVGTQPTLNYTQDFETGASDWIGKNTVTNTVGGIEINPQHVYGGDPANNNRVLEVEAGPGINSVQHGFDTTRGAVYQLDVDVSARAGHTGADSSLEVLVNGVVIGQLPGANAFGFQHHTLSFSGSGSTDVVEFRSLDANTYGGLLDNLTVKQTANAYQDHAAALPSLSATFGDSVDHSESHVIQLGAIPLGATVSDGTHSFVSSLASQSVTVFNEGGAGNWNLNAISVTAPSGFSGTLHINASATATELATGASLTSTHDFALSYGSTAFNGTAGADIIHGTTANDIINGGAGDDILSGSLGSNTFMFSQGSLQPGAAGDHILDFKVAAPGAGGDVLDISDLLSHAGVDAVAFNGHEASYLTATTSAAGNTTIAIDLDGAGAAAAVPLVTLDHVSVTLNSLLGNGQIHGA
ncbi:VCBS repeat-containing protein [Actimicrobium sp. GrIS 1.19]|uniref:retention module-containing protein n=1 Tax=Actimicrobium sp. GrIS 1.19 TaxID=3071708 RepID=UPI002DFC7EA7|nr:VCBS repeat-containing protein [Actimicrobium sp. GrIS 1.19]